MDRKIKIMVGSTVYGFETRIYSLCPKRAPGLRTTMLSSKTDIPVKSVERYVKRLKDAGLIKYSGSSKSGGYFLSDSEVRE